MITDRGSAANGIRTKERPNNLLLWFSSLNLEAKRVHSSNAGQVCGSMAFAELRLTDVIAQSGFLNLNPVKHSVAQFFQ